MEINKNVAMFVLLITIMLFEPIPNDILYNSITGRIFILLLVAFFTINHTILGLLATIILLSSLQVSAKTQGFTSIKKIITGDDRISNEDSIRPKNVCHIDNSVKFPSVIPFNMDTGNQTKF